jgi:hypothetical protein
MNNHLNHWHAEQMVRYERHEVDRAVEQARLLREAGLSGESWLARAGKALGNLLKARRTGLQDQRFIGPRTYPRKKLPRVSLKT